MRKIVLGLMGILLFMSSCEKTPEEIAVSSVSLNQSSAEMIVGESVQLQVSITPSNATDKTVIWGSSKQSVATVSNSGLVMAIAEGSSTITATVGGRSASCSVVVSKRVIAVTSIELDKTEVTLVEGESITLTATVKPNDATDKTVTWSSSAPDVASINGGKITAVKPGEAAITATSGNKTASCKVVVSKKVIPVESVTLDKAEVSLVEGESITLSATVKPDDATNKTITWSSSNETVATVSEGQVTAHKVGSALIKVITEDGGKQAECKVIVKEPTKATSIALKGASFLFSAIVGDEFSISVDYKPEDAFVDIEWSVSDASIAELIGEGHSIKLRAKDYGPATLTVRDKISNLSVSEEMKARLSDFYWTESTGLTRNGCPLVEIEIGEEHQLQCRYTPDYATRVFRSDMNGFWYYEPESFLGSSHEEPNLIVSRPSFFSIDENGKIKGIKEGLAKIHVFSPTILNNAQDLYVRVVKQRVPVTGVSLPETLEMSEGDTRTITASIIPSDATNKEVTWSCSDESVVSLSDAPYPALETQKTVTALKIGTAMLSVKTNDGGYSAQCQVVVTEKRVKVDGVSLNLTSATMVPGEQLALIATVSPSNATDKTVTWLTSDASIATVTSSGTVTAKGSGTATITVKTNDGGMTATCVVKVIVPVDSVTLDRSNVSLTEGESTTLVATVRPDDATDKTVTWSSSNSSIAAVESGKVTAIKEGTATITAKAGEKTATCTITVKKKVIAVEKVSLNKSELTLNRGGEETLVATVSPGNATDKTVSWSSSDASIASVDNNGKVKALKGGTATITAKAGEKTAACKVTVIVPVESIKLNLSSQTIKVNETLQLIATITPNDATEMKVTWSSSDNKIATVSADGLVKGISDGEAVITASAGGHTADCKLTVVRSTAGGNEGIGYDE